MKENRHYDIIVVGSGLGGSAAAHVLADTGLSILVIERGDFIRQESQNWDVMEVAVNHRYEPRETWYDGEGRPFSPRVYYNVGGSTKFFGGSALRFRMEDFSARRLPGGTTVAWPFGYGELEEWYERAEALLEVHGLAGEDPSEAPRGPFPYPPLEHEETIEVLADALRDQDLHPIHLPVAIDQGKGGRCVKGSPCDGFPCKVRAKGDAENRLLRPLLLRKTPNLTLWTNSLVETLETDPSGEKIVAARVLKEGASIRVEGETFIVSAGAVNSAALLLRSKSATHPAGLGNSSDLVGRYFMAHNNSVVMAFSPSRRNPTVFQKTLAVHDWYGAASSAGRALGAIQLRGKVKPEMLRHNSNIFVRLFGKEIARRSVDWWVMTEDLPDPENRVSIDDIGRLHLARRPTNMEAHQELIARTRTMMRRAGYPFSLVDRRGVKAIQHQCGTLRFGNDPRTSVLDQWCKAHDLDNLRVIDASFFPSSAAVNPSLTILAQALRASERLKSELGGS